MSPSFFTLFKRGRYFRAFDSADETEEAQAQREERERFAVASLAFCLRHDEGFRMHFWESVCRVQEDPGNLTSLRVEVEPEHWADLRLTAESSAWKVVCIVECKAGAPLANKQKPTCLEFKEPRVGYGWFIARSAQESGVEHRYIILGADETIAPSSGCMTSCCGFKFCQKGWLCLAENAPTGSLTADLFESLGQLGISSFRMKNASQVQVLAGFGAAAEAWEVLSVLGGPDKCRFRPSYWKIVGENPAPGHFNLGAYLKRPPEKKGTSTLHVELFAVLNPSGDDVVWVGYETGPSVKPDMFRRSVYFYCADPSSAEKMLTRLEKEFRSCRPFRDGNCVVLASAGGTNPKDLEWFETALRFIAHQSR